MPANIEIKARVRGDLESLRVRAAELATEAPRVIAQEDTFFQTPSGRLKLRVPIQGPAELIYYERANETGPKRSLYSVAAIADAQALIRVLEESLGVRGVVRKTRELFIAADTRIHLDEVEFLGNFIELEVAMPGADEVSGRRRCHELMQALGIRDEDLVEGAYIDMLEKCRV